VVGSALLTGILLFLAFSSLFMLSPLLGDRQVASVSAFVHARSPRLLSAFRRLGVLLQFLRAHARVVIWNLQVAASVKYSMRVSWPGAFERAFASLANVIHLRLLRMPLNMSLACSPLADVDTYANFNFVTVGATLLLLWLAGLWALGRRVMAAQLRPVAVRSSFDLLSLGRLLWVLSLAYSPVASAALEMFACVRVGDDWVMYSQPSASCASRKHSSYRVLAGFWLAVYVCGTPAVYRALLQYYSVPAVAGELKAAALLQAVREHVALNKAGRPASSLEVMDSGALFAQLFPNEAAAAPTDEVKHRRLLSFARERLSCRPVVWDGVHGRRMAQAETAIGSLYLPYFADMWAWLFVELLFSFLVCGVLSVILPGTTAQAFVGALLTYVYQVAYLRAQPYAEATFRLIGNANAVNLFCFMTVALLVHADVAIGRDRELFFLLANVSVVSTMFLAPIIILLRRLRWPLLDTDDARARQRESDDALLEPLLEEEVHPDVFISYREPETGRGGDGSAFALQSALEQLGFSVFVGGNSIDGGSSWPAAIHAGVERCKAFVVLCSTTYGDEVLSPWTMRELAMADNLRLPLVPVWHSGTYPPPSCALYLGNKQRIPTGHLSEGYAAANVPTEMVVEELAAALLRAGVPRLSDGDGIFIS